MTFADHVPFNRINGKLTCPNCPFVGANGRQLADEISSVDRPECQFLVATHNDSLAPNERTSSCHRRR